MHNGKSLISVFREFSASISKVFILVWTGGGGAGHWAVILSGLDTFLIFPNFLRSSVFKNKFITVVSMSSELRAIGNYAVSNLTL